MLDYNLIEEISLREKPNLIICGGSAYSQDWDYKIFRMIADKINALLLADISHPSGLIASKLLNDPVSHCHIITTTTHKTLRGPRGGMIMMGEDFENPWGHKTPKGKLKKMSNIINSGVFPGSQGGPLEHVIASKAVAFEEASKEDFKEYSSQVVKNSKMLSSVISGLGFRIVSGGTDNHQFTIDLSKNNLTGAEISTLLRKIGIVVNKNGIPYDNHPPKITSGIRLGTPALTSRGMKEDQMIILGNLIVDIINSRNDEKKLTKLSNEVKELAHSYKLPGVD